MSPRWPWHARAALVVCLTLSTLVGLRSFQEAALLAGRLEQAQPLLPSTLTASERELVEKAFEAERGALRAMRGSRVAVLTLLSLSSALLFVTGLRLWRPLGVSRLGMLKLGAGTAVVCAVLRTVDGAQRAVVARKTVAAAAKVIAASEEIAAQAQDPRAVELASRALPGLGVAMSVLFTALVAGLFAVLAQYLRSGAARKAFAPENPESAGT